jgi:hypothetical protein
MSSALVNDSSWRRALVLLRAFRDGYAKQRGWRAAMITRWIAIGWCCMGLVAKTESAESVAGTFRFILWLAAFGVMTGIDSDLARHRASLQLAVIRGYPRRWIPLVAPLARAALAFRLLVLPVLVFGVVGLAISQSWLPLSGAAIAIGGLLAWSVALALALSAISWAATELAPSNPKKTYAALIVVPALLHTPIPELPSVIHMGGFIVDVSLGRFIT